MQDDDLNSDNTEIVQNLYKRAFSNVREDLLDNPYISEALTVLYAGGYRSAIGSIWNAVVDDLRNKIIHRSLSLFNKAVKQKQEIKCYEDFQNFVNDDDLIEGAFKIGVIGWEASKVLKHSKETRHIFDGHPRSSNPSILKVLGMFDDCARYVLNEQYPPQIVDIDEYLGQMATSSFDRNGVAIANALTELPDVYKTELIHRLFDAYIHESAPTDLRSNIELTAPILWPVLPKDLKIQIVRRVDKVIVNSNIDKTREAFAFVRLVNASAYLSASAKQYIINPLVENLCANLDNFEAEDRCVRSLAPYAANIPADLMSKYVSSITQTYVGHIGGSARYSRTDFYADGAATIIQKMFESFDDTAAIAFVECMRHNSTLRRRIENPVKLNRLRSLANIVLERVSTAFTETTILHALADQEREIEFWTLLKQHS